MPPKAASGGSADRYYPNLEEFLEQEPRDAVGDTWQAAREKLAAIKGTKAAGAKKVLAAIDKTEQLLHHLYDVKEKMGEASKGKK